MWAVVIEGKGILFWSCHFIWVNSYVYCCWKAFWKSYVYCWEEIWKFGEVDRKSHQKFVTLWTFPKAIQVLFFWVEIIFTIGSLPFKLTLWLWSAFYIIVPIICCLLRHTFSLKRRNNWYLESIVHLTHSDIFHCCCCRKSQTIY